MVEVVVSTEGNRSCDGVNDVAGMIEDVEEMAILVHADPDADGGESCGRAADFYRSTDYANAASHHTSCWPTITSVSVQTVDVPVPP